MINWTYFCFLFLLACSPQANYQPVALISFAQANREDIFLNEPLVFKFNTKIDPTSVTHDTLIIQASDGQRAQGGIVMDGGGKWIKFVPQTVLNSSLSDGGYLPDTRYTVTILGFPSLRGIRSTTGGFLENSVVTQFASIDHQHLPDGRATPFLDEQHSIPFPELRLDSPGLDQIAKNSPILLYFSKPLRPDRVTRDNIQIFRTDEKIQAEQVPIEVNLLANQLFAQVSIKLLEEPHPDAIYFFELSKDLTDFSGNPVLPFGGYGSTRVHRLQFRP